MLYDKQLKADTISPSNAVPVQVQAQAPVAVAVTFDDSSSESVLSDNMINHKSTPSMISDDSSGSISPQTYSPKLERSSNINTTLPSHDGSSPPVLLPTNDIESNIKLPKTTFTINPNSSIPAPVHYLKNRTKHKILSANQLHPIPKPSSNVSVPQQRARYITDTNLIDEYLKNDVSSAIGVNVGTWSDEIDNGQDLRQKLIANAKQPLVAEKDKWDIALDTGLAYPHKTKKKSDPFKNFNRDQHINTFQSTQSERVSGNHKLRKNRKKKGNCHNTNRFYNRKRKNLIQS